MLYIHLGPIFRLRGIEKPYTFLVKSGFTPHAANILLNSQSRVFRLDHVERLCTVLLCEPNDLLRWVPEKGRLYADNFPLSQLKSTGEEVDWRTTMDTMPLKQLKQAAKAFKHPEKTDP